MVGAQIVIGGTSAIIPSAAAALSLGLVGRKRPDARISRNESFNHGGNFVAAALAGMLGQRLGYSWIFYLVCAFAAASAAVVNLINSREIDDDLTRGGGSGDVVALVFFWTLMPGRPTPNSRHNPPRPPPETFPQTIKPTLMLTVFPLLCSNIFMTFLPSTGT